MPLIQHKTHIMKSLALILIISGLLAVFGCKKDKESERFKLLTTPTWTTDSLLANGVDASGPGQLLEKFKGNAKFNKDGTGYFGVYPGTWRFNSTETQLIIETDSLAIPVITDIVELTNASLKVTTLFVILQNTYNIRMTFKPK